MAFSGFAPLDTRLAVTRFREFSSKISHPLVLVLLSDLHGTLYGQKQELLLAVVRRQSPDLILMAGDMADPKVPLENFLVLLDGLRGIAPSFYVSGNHEQWTRDMLRLERLFGARGATVLKGFGVSLTARGERLFICGVDDPHAFVHSHHSLALPPEWKKQFYACCSAAASHPEDYRILLSHRPEPVSFYQNSGFDLVASGHAHGGQIRLPICPGGLFAPHQGFFPRYAGGQYRLGSTSLIVSRGLCLNRLPRIFNPPEVAVIELLPADSGREKL